MEQGRVETLRELRCVVCIHQFPMMNVTIMNCKLVLTKNKKKFKGQCNYQVRYVTQADLKLLIYTEITNFFL